MKNILFFLLLSFPILLLAQSNDGRSMISGRMAVSIDLDDSDNSLLELDTRYFHFTGSKTAIGFEVGLLTDFDDAIFNLGPGLRHYFSLDESGGVFADISGGVTKLPNNTGWYFRGGLGYSFILSENVYFDLSGVYVRQEFDPGTFNNIVLSLGFNYLFGTSE